MLYNGHTVLKQNSFFQNEVAMQLYKHFHDNLISVSLDREVHETFCVSALTQGGGLLSTSSTVVCVMRALVLRSNAPEDQLFLHISHYLAGL